MTEAVTKKELIYIEKHPKAPGSIYDGDTSTNFHMALLGNSCGKNKNGLKVYQRVSRYFTCRDILTAILCALANRENKSLGNAGTNQIIEDFDFERLRLLISTSILKVSKKENIDIYRSRLFAGKSAINLLEDYAGWAPKSVITAVTTDKPTNKLSGYWMITGPKEWVTAPQMFSLCILILRMSMFCGQFYGLGEIDTSNVENMLQSLLNISKAALKHEADSGGQAWLKNDAKHFKIIHKYILPILKNHKKLFFEDIKDNYPGPPNFGGYGGITSFVECKTNYQQLTDKFKAIILNK